jgi:outer membrane protein OmpA-like peptidoglycan-associated protein
MRPLVAVVMTLGAALAFATATEKYSDPDDPVTLAAARAALGSARVLDIVGMTRGIAGVLKDLGAKVTDQEIRIELSADVLFDFDKHDLRAEAVPSLEKVAEVVRAHREAPVTIEGHTDGKGTDAYNQPLSERRAVAVKTWLVERGGANPAKIATKGWGKTKPVASNTKPDGSDDPEGRKKNRRVEITVRTR